MQCSKSKCVLSPVGQVPNSFGIKILEEGGTWRPFFDLRLVCGTLPLSLPKIRLCFEQIPLHVSMCWLINMMLMRSRAGFSYILPSCLLLSTALLFYMSLTKHSSFTLLVHSFKRVLSLILLLPTSTRFSVWLRMIILSTLRGRTTYLWSQVMLTM